MSAYRLYLIGDSHTRHDRRDGADQGTASEHSRGSSQDHGLPLASDSCPDARLHMCLRTLPRCAGGSRRSLIRIRSASHATVSCVQPPCTTPLSSRSTTQHRTGDLSSLARPSPRMCHECSPLFQKCASATLYTQQSLRLSALPSTNPHNPDLAAFRLCGVGVALCGRALGWFGVGIDGSKRGRSSAGSWPATAPRKKADESGGRGSQRSSRGAAGHTGRTEGRAEKHLRLSGALAMHAKIEPTRV